jgi:glycosyltransferase involved in cell wall biosynthesis
MRRIRICQMITELRPAGAERSLFELSTRLDRTRFDVQVVALRGGDVAEWLARAGTPTTVLGVRGRWDVLKLRKLAGLLRGWRPDVLHSHLFHADLVGRVGAWMAGVPHLVHTVRTAEGRFRPWHFALPRVFAGRCRRLICVSQSVRDLHARRSGLPPSKYAVIPNGIAPENYAHDHAARTRLREEWGLAKDVPLAAFVGRLAPEKGIEVLLGAMSHLAARGTPVPVVIAGDGPQRCVVENFIAHGEGGTQCRFLGFTHNVRDVLSAADMLIMPSRWEGWPLAAGEAMAAGLPVVAARVPGLVDVVVDGKTGFWIGRDDVVGFAGAIERLAGDAKLRRRMGDCGRDRIAQEFSIDATVAAHEKLYLQIAGA